MNLHRSIPRKITAGKTGSTFLFISAYFFPE
jgi:hypothetical protein